MNYLPGLESHLNNLVADLLLQRHEDAIVFLGEGESALIEEGLDILELSVVLVLVLDLLLEGATKLLSTVIDRIREGTRLGRSSEEARASHSHCHDSASGAHAARAAAHKESLHRLLGKHVVFVGAFFEWRQGNLLIIEVLSIRLLYSPLLAAGLNLPN